MTPAQPLEAGEIAIGGDPFTAALDRERSEIGVGDQRAACPALAAQAGEDLPATGAWADDQAVRSVEQCGREASALSSADGCRNARGLVTMRTISDTTSPDKAKSSSASLTSSSQRRYRG
jgi:hypothetical protein